MESKTFYKIKQEITKPQLKLWKLWVKLERPSPTNPTMRFYSVYHDTFPACQTKERWIRKTIFILSIRDIPNHAQVHRPLKIQCDQVWSLRTFHIIIFTVNKYLFTHNKSLLIEKTSYVRLRKTSIALITSLWFRRVTNQTTSLVTKSRITFLNF